MNKFLLTRFILDSHHAGMAAIALQSPHVINGQLPGCNPLTIFGNSVLNWSE
ncbi:TPA_asm: hypothetical protein G3V16_002592 [Salmonella enterica subsp. enterica serovar Brandenburg]|nr:hypothetical protein [Escherichia coli]EHY4085112.1 hypothetical protein [Escherichia coli]ELA5487150.1 hypothetical protein [Salmonella enterica subsp. enterica serovar Brandenburg]HAE1821284.1 hypothetical protein [Salmonella enterica subsp. enterica serovar Brandenburg]HAE8037905.1 hypothetical protein [Salmonella enterica subsp. enterica serovar Brandenburg]